MADGTSIEVMLVGREGMVGLPVLQGEDTTVNTRAFIQLEGNATKVKASVVREEFKRAGKFHSLLLRQMHFAITQTAQTAACNRMHDLEESLSRWLLMVHDRIQEDRFILTHEFLAQMLGTRRSSVTLAAGIFQRAGLIEYKRGHLHIQDRKGLEDVACECYPVIKTSFDAFLGTR